MPTPRSKAGRLHLEDGSVEPARFYYSNHEEEPPPLTQVDSRYTTWIEDDGTVGIGFVHFSRRSRLLHKNSPVPTFIGSSRRNKCGDARQAPH